MRRPPGSTLFPSRRSSDLIVVTVAVVATLGRADGFGPVLHDALEGEHAPLPEDEAARERAARARRRGRSEAHTAELQSLGQLVAGPVIENKPRVLDRLGSS